MKPISIALLLLAGTAFAQADNIVTTLRSDATLQEKPDAGQEPARVGTGRAVPVLTRVSTTPIEPGLVPNFNGTLPGFQEMVDPEIAVDIIAGHHIRAAGMIMLADCLV